MIPRAAANLAAAAALGLFGLGVAAIAASYPLGNMLRPGPGFFPLGVGCLIAALAAAVALEIQAGARRASEDVALPAPSDGFRLRPVLAVSAGMLAFAALVDRTGFVPATFALVFLSALAEPGRNWAVVAAIAAFMVVFGVTLFIWGLGLPMSTFGPR